MTRARDISRLLGRTDNEVDSEGEIITTSGQIVDSAFVLSQAPASSSFTFYNTLDSLPSNADEGQLAFVEANTRMYLNDGSGWYSIAAVNLSPSLTLSPSGSIELATDGTPSTVTITATDTDDPSAILSYSVESDGNMLATGTTVTQDSSVFTITPITQESGGVAGDFTLSFKVSDQIDEAIANKSFSLTFQSTGTLTRSASSVNEGSSVTFTLPVSGYTDGDTIPYTISGIQAADLNPATLSGNMVVSGANATKVITTSADNTTEGAQTMTFNADNQSVNVTINDTSLAPAISLITTITPITNQATNGGNTYIHNSRVGTGATNLTGNQMVLGAVSWFGSTAGVTLTSFNDYDGWGGLWTKYQVSSHSQYQGVAFVYKTVSSNLNVGVRYGYKPRMVFSGNVSHVTYTAWTFNNPAGISGSDFTFINYSGNVGYAYIPVQFSPSKAILNTWTIGIGAHAKARSTSDPGLLKEGNSPYLNPTQRQRHLWTAGDINDGGTYHYDYNPTSTSAGQNGFQALSSNSGSNAITVLAAHLNK